jgi:cobalt-zinc-cadmium efflux system protein
MTFGYHRVGVLAALVNAASLVVIALIIFWEAISRVRQPERVDGAVMIAVAAVAVILNTAISLSLRKGRDDLNVRSAYLHMLGDAISAGGVVLAGLIVWVTGAHQADPIVSILIGLLILWSSWDILRESVTVLLEGVPGDVDVAAVESAIRAVPNVGDVHHIHAWTISSGFLACSCHVVPTVAGVEAQQRILDQVQRMLERQFDFHHTTIQVETTPCAPRRACGDGGHPTSEAP